LRNRPYNRQPVTHVVTLIPGDGTGPELTEATRRVLEATGVDFEWDIEPAGADVMHEHGGDPLPEATLESIRKNGVALKGPITTPIGEGFRSVNVALRNRLDLYAQVRPCKTYPGVRTLYKDIDLVVVRENTEDMYVGIEFEEGTQDMAELSDWLASHGHRLPHPDSGVTVKPISISGTRAVFEFAFDYVRRHGRRKITAVHKANIMKLSDGLFLKCSRAVAEQYPDIEYKEIIIDACAMWLVRDPQSFDILLCENLYGDILSDLTAGLVGGLGVVPGANIGANEAVFEAVHGSAPDIAGKGIANPTAMILSACLMLDHLHERPAADRIRAAINQVLREGQHVTRDLGGTASTTEYTDALCAALSA
jgi:isocitrate dehydrogenase (NAD+)